MSETVRPASTRPGPPRALWILVGLAAAVVAIAGLKSAAAILAPTFLAVTLVITVHPLQRWLTAHRVPRFVAAGVSLVILYVIVLGLMGSLSWAIAQLAIQIPRYQEKFEALWDDTLELLAQFGADEAWLRGLAAGFDPTSLIGAARTLVDQVAGATSLLVLLVTLMFFLVVDAMDLPRRMEISNRIQPSLVRAMELFAAGVRRYWLVSAVFGLIVAIFDVVGLWFLQVPLALVWGLVSFITNFIPNIGFVLGLVPPALLALLDGGPGKMVAVIVLYSVLNVVIQVIIQPKFTGDAVGVTPAVSFLSLVIWAFILGPLGALLALPMTLFVKTMLVDGDPRAQWVNAFIASNPEPVTSPPPRIVRRRKVSAASVPVPPAAEDHERPPSADNGPTRGANNESSIGANSGPTPADGSEPPPGASSGPTPADGGEPESKPET